MRDRYVILRKDVAGLTGGYTVYDSYAAAVEQLAFTREYIEERLAPLAPTMPQPEFYVARLEVLDD